MMADDYRQAALELHAAIRTGLAWIAGGGADFIAHRDMEKVADKWRPLLESDVGEA